MSALGACCAALAATPARLLRPRPADRAFLSTLVDAGLPRARAAVRLTALTQARQTVPTAVVAEGVRRPRRVGLGMTSFLVEHPEARFLVDPAMCAGVHREVLPQLPGPLRVVVAPDKPVLGLLEVLGTVGIGGDDIDFALPTHLHWDHVSGLLELPGSIPVRTGEVERAWALDGPVAPLGVARRPLLDRRYDVYSLDGPPVATFASSHDVFGDGSVVLVDLAGHTPGSVGVLLAVDDGSRVLLAGDAVWHGTQITHLRGTAPFPGRLADADRVATFAGVHRLHALPEEIRVVASHDRAAAAAFAPGRRS